VISEVSHERVNRAAEVRAHLDSAHAPLRDKVDRNREQRVGVVPLALKLETTRGRPGRLADLVDGPLEPVRMRVEGVRAMRGRFRDRRFGTGRQGDRDDDVVQREGGVLEFVLEVDRDRAGVGGWPAVD
jgi:hypothetical protein